MTETNPAERNYEILVNTLAHTYWCIKLTEDEKMLKHLLGVAFQLGRVEPFGHAELDGLGYDLNEWAALKTESPEWAKQYEKDMRKSYPKFFVIADKLKKK